MGIDTHQMLSIFVYLDTYINWILFQILIKFKISSIIKINNNDMIIKKPKIIIIIIQDINDYI